MGPSDLTRGLEAALLLGPCAIAGIVLAFGPNPARRRLPLPVALAIVFVVAVVVRGIASLIQDGGLYDIFDAYRVVGNHFRTGGDIFTPPSLGLSNYPPVIYYWWAAATAVVPTGAPHLFAALVRAPYWVVDAAIAPTLAILIRKPIGTRAAWLYALNPIAIAVPTLHGQFDSLPVLGLLLAVAYLRMRPRLSAWMLSAAVAVKTWPAYFLPLMLGLLRPGRRVPYFTRVLAIPVAAFIVYGVIHPWNLPRGIAGVLFYTPHRQGLGTSLLFPASWGNAIVPVTNGLLLMGLLWMAITISRRDFMNAPDVVALAILMVLGFSASISDQYLVWPFAILLFGRHLQMSALLAAAMTPATIVIDITSGGAGLAAPWWLLGATTLCTWVAVIAMWRNVFPSYGSVRQTDGDVNLRGVPAVPAARESLVPQG